MTEGVLNLAQREEEDKHRAEHDSHSRSLAPCRASLLPSGVLWRRLR
jgi:hypothetical protein